MCHRTPKVLVMCTCARLSGVKTAVWVAPEATKDNSLALRSVRKITHTPCALVAELGDASTKVVWYSK